MINRKNDKQFSGLSIDCNGLMWEHLNQKESDYFYEEIFVKQLYFKYFITINEGSTIIDVGANIGLFSLFCCQKHKNLKIYAIEPLPPIFEVLQRNLSNEHQIVSLFNVGVVEDESVSNVNLFHYFAMNPGESTRHQIEREQQRKRLRHELSLNEGNRNKHFLYKNKHKMYEIDNQYNEIIANLDEEDKYSESFCCKLKSLQTIITESLIEKVDLLKIDVEGDELLVLKSIGSQWDKIRQIVLEVHDIDGRLDAVISVLRQKSFMYIKKQQKTELNDDFLSFIPNSLQLYIVYAIRKD